MREERLAKLQELYESLRLENDALLAEKPINHHLELVIADRAVLLKGNSEGLAYLATKLLELATDQLKGKHYHFDESTMFDQCDNEFIISYEQAEWEEQG